MARYSRTRNRSGWAATDQGGIVRRQPWTVLKPDSVRDIACIVHYANKRKLAVAIRRRGHARYGQTRESWKSKTALRRA